MKFSATVDTKALEAALKELGAKATSSALTQALNRSGSAMQSEASRIARSAFAIKASTLKADALTVEKASASKHEVALRVSGKRVPLLDFGNPKQTPTMKGTSVTVKRGKRQQFKGAFIANMRFGKAVFWRKVEGGKRVPRGPVSSIAGPSAAQMLGAKASTDAVLAKGKATFVSRFQHEITRRLKK